MERENQPGTVEHFMKWQQEKTLKIWEDAKKEEYHEMEGYAKDRLLGRKTEYKAYKAAFYDSRSGKWTEVKNRDAQIREALVGLIEMLLDVEEE